MPFYLYECTNPKCGTKQEELRSLSKREDAPKCAACGSETKRIFHPDSGNIVMWKDPGDTRPSFAGPTRKPKYTVRDMAAEKGWWNGKYS